MGTTSAMHDVLQHNNKEICVQVQGFITLTHITHTHICFYNYKYNSCASKWHTLFLPPGLCWQTPVSTRHLVWILLGANWDGNETQKSNAKKTIWTIRATEILRINRRSFQKLRPKKTNQNKKQKNTKQKNKTNKKLAHESNMILKCTFINQKSWQEHEPEEGSLCQKFTVFCVFWILHNNLHKTRLG